MKIIPFPFQDTGIDFLVTHKRGCLFDEQGIGKSLQALLAATAVKAKNILIICRASLRFMWEAEINKIIECDKQIIHIKSKLKETPLLSKTRYCICSFNYLQKKENVERLKKVKWDIIISDEHQYCKNYRAKTTKGFVELAKNHEGYLWMLTGTPASKNGQDYWIYLDTVEPGKWGSYWQFSKEYCNVTRDFWSGGYIYKGVKKKMIPVLKSAFNRVALRRRKKEVLPELPDKIITKFPVEVDEEIVAECLNLDIARVVECIEKGFKLDAHVASVVRSIGMGKVSAAVEYIVECSEPIVVFCAHIDVVAEIVKGVKKHRPVVTYTGAETAFEKQAAVDSFQLGLVDVIVLNLQAGNAGITLTAASHMLFVELPWSPAVRSQARDRCHRIGQKDCVNIIEMVATNTIDEAIVSALDEKEKFMVRVMGDINL